MRTFKRLPTAVYNPLNAKLEGDLPINKRISWLYAIDPYVIARMDHQFKIRNDLPWDAPENKYVLNGMHWYYHCPSNSNLGPNNVFAHYIGITGIAKDAAELPAGDPRTGIFGYARDRGISINKIPRGASNTIAVAETAMENGPWLAAGYSTARGLDENGAAYLGQGGQFNSYHGQNGAFSVPYTTHVLIADASVRALTDEFDKKRFEDMAVVGVPEP